MSDTRLSRLHPYPAMVANDLANDLIAENVNKGDVIIDPFCGSGRIVAAATACGARAIGLDSNPLACLITAAKCVRPRLSALREFLGGAPFNPASASAYAPDFGSSVSWYSKSTALELGGIIARINAFPFNRSEKIVVATALSAAARAASFCHTHSWKLHRIREAQRKDKTVSVNQLFTDRLQYYLKEAPLGDCHHAKIVCGDVRLISTVSRRALNVLPQADVIITSPPYGDSATTVQYGMASALCLDVVRRIKGLERLFQYGRVIERACLGGTLRFRAEPLPVAPCYWDGPPNHEAARRVATFLDDFDLAFKGIASLLRPKGRLVMIIGERSVWGHRIQLREFAEDCLATYGLRLKSCRERRFVKKRLPRRINRFGGSSSKADQRNGITPTMDREFVLAFAS